MSATDTTNAAAATTTTTTYKGSCSCGAITLEIKGDPMFVGLCHCHNCQKSTSTAFSTNWVLPRPALTVLSSPESPAAATYALPPPSTSLRHFCPTCSSALWTESPDKMPGIVVVKAGVLDGGAIAKFAPGSESFTRRRPGWVGCVEGAVQFEGAYGGGGGGDAVSE